MANRGMANPTLRVGTPLSNVALNALFAAAWPDRVEADFRPVHARSLT